MADNNWNRNTSSNENWDKNQGRYVDDNNYGQGYTHQGYRDLDRDGLIGNAGGFYGGTSYTGSNYDDWNNNQYMNRHRSEYNKDTNYNPHIEHRGKWDYNNDYTQSRYGNVNNNAYQDYRSYDTYSDYDRNRGNQHYRRNNDYDRWGNTSYRSGNYNRGYDSNYGNYDYGDNRPYYADWGNTTYNNYNDDYGNRNRNWNNDQRRNSNYRSGDRNWWDRTKDEVASWFGDEDAERRRRRDEQQSGEHKGKGPRDYHRSDERIREDVSDKLSDDPFIDASDIDVKVENGEVTLSGTVESRNAKRRAEDIIESVSGVKNVLNNLRVGSTATVGSSTIRSNV